ncbi:MAG: FecR family protein [Chelatococcus sp.]|uniref:FecR family protein n=1 Tax=Chelatococcus sp. TaxID=1953771 RepID=UPI0025C25C75|nr:FecR family protein [Chelatococcus sp.]MBX3536671.1 FecR family protein [Chelatococcus sp.]
MTADGKRHHVDIALSDEAIDWVVRLNSGRATQTDRQAFADWRLQSEQHERAAQEAETIWHGVGLAGDGLQKADRKAARSKATRRALLGGVLLVAAGLAIERSGFLGPGRLADHATGVGEQRLIVLPDGSSVFLNASAALAVDFTDAERRLTLLEGEAIFTVARDTARPLIVEASGGEARAIGTIFNVDIRPEEVVVTVLEGVVEIATQVGSVTARLDQRVRYAASSRPSAAETVDADVETAWRRGKLIFNRRPLGDVVAEIKRYRDGQIVIVNPRLRALEVTGVFDLADPETILRTIEETLPVHVTRLPFVTIIR